MELTKKEAVRLHREMWRWIAEQTEKQKRKIGKREYFRVMGIVKPYIPYRKCYCCEYVKQRRSIVQCEKICPIDWGSEFDSYSTPSCLQATQSFSVYDGYYSKWLDTKNFKEAAWLAKKIAELPERDVF